MAEIETERLKLRQFILDDLDELYNLYNNSKAISVISYQLSVISTSD
ncbi:MAG: hypothetical protein SWX82_11450 [Cyanobacteriota bacterium]|nr:hypothetical protein [Cyanobacteriota bacterium]